MLPALASSGSAGRDRSHCLFYIPQVCRAWETSCLQVHLRSPCTPTLSQSCFLLTVPAATPSVPEPSKNPHCQRTSSRLSTQGLFQELPCILTWSPGKPQPHDPPGHFDPQAFALGVPIQLDPTPHLPGSHPNFKVQLKNLLLPEPPALSA